MYDNLPFDRRTAGDILADPDSSATVLHLILLATYGDELHGDDEPMDPVELWLRVKEDYHVVVPEENENKINALMFALQTDAFYDDPLAFTSICSALYSGDLGDMVDGVMEDLTISEMLWGIYEVELNRGDSQDFCTAIDQLIDEVTQNEAESNEDLEEEEVIPYYQRFVEEQRDDMFVQMKLLGVDDAIISQMVKTDLTPANNFD